MKRWLSKKFDKGSVVIVEKKHYLDKMENLFNDIHNYEIFEFCCLPRKKG